MADTLEGRLDALELSLRAARETALKQQGMVESLTASVAIAETKVSNLSELLVTYEKVSTLLTSFADSRQGAIVRAVENLVTHGLRLIFEQELSFIVELETKARRTTCSFYIQSYVDNETIKTPILSSRGGGMASVAAFLLRVILVILSGTRRFLVLDETFAQLSKDYEPNVAQFIRTLCDKAGFQILLVTHSGNYSEYADIVYKTSLKKGWTIFEEVDT